MSDSRHIALSARLRLRPLLMALALMGVNATATASSSVLLEWSEDIPADFRALDDTGLAATDNLWDRIRAGFRMADTPLPAVARYEQHYASRPDYVQQVTQRARRYLYHIVDALEARSMPTELALLPIVESSFKPTALSASAASGIWQFIPSTGRHYGLAQHAGYDGRLDFPEATRAALDYLGKLYLDFGDWELALAAYNCGEGCVARAIQKNAAAGLPTQYASLALPEETRNYVPKLLALKHLISQPERFNLTLEPIPNAPYFDVVSVPAGLDLPAAARLANVNPDEFFALNAAYSKGVIQHGTPAQLLVPSERASDFQRTLESGDWDKWVQYPARRGDSVKALADDLGTQPERLAQHTPLKVKNGRFVTDQIVLVPASGNTGVPADAARTHTVATGETLYAIARANGLSVDDLREANPRLGDTLRLDQTLSVPGRVRTAQTPQALRTSTTLKRSLIIHTVQPGDTLYSLAQHYKVTVADLEGWNRDAAVGGGRGLRPGTHLTIR